jgi:hypothetical protein
MAAVNSGDLSEAFNLLLSATSKGQVEKCCNLTVASLSEVSKADLAATMKDILNLESNQVC